MLVRTMQPKMDELVAPELARVTWACATVKQSEDSLFTAVARRVREFNTHGIANTAWALAAMKRSDERLLAQLATAAEGSAKHFNAQELANAFEGAGRRGRVESERVQCAAAREHSMGVNDVGTV
eukprot:gnl/TRDRNA2_/TRDRNA2_174217_c13_seq7.p2 gnl/TRDRNA2_/TRDRNA2_174217_c13~~gnl/TRDRNA2_/TRDRNA2_174217_c13_seq7.p2  ORF type:complete len:125 (-),score=21.68 gnl/TRDRNA2_/TRDRNA2_174217_c13_seq7:131-505(-)